MWSTIENQRVLNSNGDKIVMVQMASAPWFLTNGTVVEGQWGVFHVILYVNNRGFVVQILLTVGCSLVGHFKSLNKLVIVRGGSVKRGMADMTWMGLKTSDKIPK